MIFVIYIFLTLLLYLLILISSYNKIIEPKSSMNREYIRSAFNQDILLYHLYFEGKNYDDGFFVEIGAHDGYTSSNTVFFEKELKWNGLLIESNPENCKKLKENSLKRSKSHIICSPICMSDYVSIEGKSYRSKISKRNNSAKLYKCRKLYDIFAKYDIKKIDFFSLDVEGSEFEVLQTFNFSIPVSYIMIEKGNHIRLCEKMLYKYGLRREKLFRSPTDFLYTNTYKKV